MFSIRCREKRGQLHRKNISILLCGQLSPGLTVFSQNIPTLVKQVMEHLRSPETAAHGPVPALLLERSSVSARTLEDEPYFDADGSKNAGTSHHP